MKTATHLIAWTLLSLGLLILLYDVFIIWRCGFDLNDVCAITDDWGPIDWPTGERPAFTFIPAFVYALGLCLAGVLAFAFWPEELKPFPGKVFRGTE